MYNIWHPFLHKELKHLYKIIIIFISVSIYFNNGSAGVVYLGVLILLKIVKSNLKQDKQLRWKWFLETGQYCIVKVNLHYTAFV